MSNGFSSIILVVLAVVILGVVISGGYLVKQQKLVQINSFDDCVKAGYPVEQSYPEQCKTPDGRNFVKPTPNNFEIPNPQPTGVISQPPDQAVKKPGM